MKKAVNISVSQFCWDLPAFMTKDCHDPVSYYPLLLSGAAQRTGQ